MTHHDVGEDAGIGEADAFAAQSGSDRVVGIDDLLDAAENYGAGAGGFMTRPALRLLLAPQVGPVKRFPPRYRMPFNLRNEGLTHIFMTWQEVLTCP